MLETKKQLDQHLRLKDCQIADLVCVKTSDTLLCYEVIIKERLSRFDFSDHVSFYSTIVCISRELEDYLLSLLNKEKCYEC